MRLIRKNVEREAEGSAAEKLISDGFTPMKKANTRHSTGRENR